MNEETAQTLQTALPKPGDVGKIAAAAEAIAGMNPIASGLNAIGKVNDAKNDLQGFFANLWNAGKIGAPIFFLNLALIAIILVLLNAALREK